MTNTLPTNLNKKKVNTYYKKKSNLIITGKLSHHSKSNLLSKSIYKKF